MRLPRALRRLPRRELLTALAVLALLVAAFNVYWFRHDFAALGGRLSGRHAEEAERWQQWARHYDQLFGMLSWGEPVAFQTAGHKSSGIVFERTADGMTARPALLLERADPGVVLVFEPGAAEQLLATAPATEPGEIWQMVKQLLYEGRIRVWSDPDLRRLERGGYLAFLRAIDTRPQGMDWQQVHAVLGMTTEPPPPLERLPEGRAGEVVRRAIHAAGGWEAWADKEGVEYRKRTIRFGDGGEVERETVQRHLYRLHPSPQMRIEWQEDGREVVLINDGQQAVKLADGRLATSQEDRDQAWNSTWGSHYVFAMPFKLTDPGAHLADAGRRRLPDGTEADAVLVTYDPGAGSAGGMHTWTYYFDDDGRLVANFLTHGSGEEDHSFTEYVEHARADGLVLHARRWGYASNVRGERLRKTSEIRHEEIRFDPPLDEELFRVPTGSAP